MFENSHRARKRFSQNFLHNQTIINRIIAAIAPVPDAHIIEIGPGKGALTEPLLEYVPKIDVIEIDRGLVAFLETKFNLDKKRIMIHQQNALTVDFSSFGYNDLRIVGNLPYNIGTPLLFHLLTYTDYLQDMTFMLQKEVVDRMVASPGNKTYGRLSVMLQYACEITPLFIVKPSAFQPIPRVDSAVVRLIPRETIQDRAHDMEVFVTVIRRAFSQRRKTIRNALKGIIDADLMASLGIKPDLRAEDLNICDFVLLANTVQINNTTQ